MNDKYKHNSRPSNSLLSYSPRKCRTHSPEEPLPKRSKGSSTSTRRESYLESREHTTSLSKQQNNQFESSSNPRELLDPLFRASECELCNVQFTAPIMSKMHYSGKQHMKNVRHFMERWSFKTGNPIPPYKEHVSSTNVQMPDYCELCDVVMLTLNEKILHISGKKHNKILNDPTKCRKKALHTVVKHVDGNVETYQTLDFSRKETQNEEGTNKKYKFECKQCGIMVSSEDSLMAHLNGKKHKEELKYKELNKIKSRPESCSTRKCIPCKMNFKSEQDMEKHKQTNKHKLSLLNQDVGDRVIPGLEFWYCIRCKAQYKGSKEYTEHLFDEKHRTLEMNCASMQNDTDLFYCTVCDLLINRDGQDDHMNDLEHKRKSVKSDTMTLITNIANSDFNTMYYSCPDCPDAGSMSFLELNAHLLTSDHTDRVLTRNHHSEVPTKL